MSRPGHHVGVKSGQELVEPVFGVGSYLFEFDEKSKMGRQKIFSQMIWSEFFVFMLLMSDGSMQRSQ
jgi:hypothetical protein